MSFPRYPAYKDSGVEWLGRLPAHWTIASPVKAFTLINGYAFPADKFADEGIPVIRMSEINCGALSLDEAKRIDADLVPSRFLLNKEDVLLGLSGSIDALAIVKEEDLPCALNQRVAAFRGREKFCTSKWAFWFFQSAAYKDQLLAILPQTTIVNVGLDDLKNVRLAAPPIDEQIAIDAFLDHETAKIDALVAEQNLLITLLKEKRQAVISHAVTKGLDPSVPMKDSGVEWLGEVPEHWAVTKLGRFARLRGGFAFSSDDFVDEGIQIVRMNNLKRGTIDLAASVCVPDEKFVLSANLNAGDLVWGMSGSIGDTGSLGNFARIRENDLPCLLNQRVGRFDVLPSYLHLDFLEQLIQAHYFYEQIQLQVTGTAQFNVSSDQVQSCIVALPPVEEQVSIASFLVDKAKHFDKLILVAKLEIDLLSERRSALITAAVTGQIDVRGLAHQEAA